MTKYILVILFSLAALSILQSQESGIVNASLLNVLSGPSMDSTIVSTLREGDTVEILQRHGSSTWSNGTLDEWFLINAYPEKWVNAFYVYELPMNIPIFIPGERNGIIYDDYYRIDEVKREYDDHLTFHVEVSSLSSCGREIYERDYWISSSLLPWVSSKSIRMDTLIYRIRNNLASLFPIITEEYLEKIESENKSNELFTNPGLYIRFTFGGIRELSIADPQYILPYGVQVGISADRIRQILGEPMDIRMLSDHESILSYYNDSNVPNEGGIAFWLENNTVSRIAIDSGLCGK